MSSSKKYETIYETDIKKIDGRYKNKNKFCKGCKLKKECWKGKAAMIVSCIDYV